MTIPNGRIYRFSSGDLNWCSDCYIYYAMDTQAQGNYYTTIRINSKYADLSDINNIATAAKAYTT